MPEVLGEGDNSMMLYSIGIYRKNRPGRASPWGEGLGAKELYSGKRPYSLLHVDTIRKFRQIVLFRECMAVELGHGFLVRVNQERLAMNIGLIDHGSAVQIDRSGERRTASMFAFILDPLRRCTTACAAMVRRRMNS